MIHGDGGYVYHDRNGFPHRGEDEEALSGALLVGERSAFRLAPYAQYIIASPEYLHLSNVQNNLFNSLDSLNGLSTAEIARRFASLSFERLKRV